MSDPRKRERGWWSRNWLWALPAGCGCGCLGVVLVVVTFFGGALAVVTGSIRNSWAYEESLALAKRHPEVVAALGEPIEAGWFTSGSISVTGPTGEASFAIPLQGPQGRATLFVVATKTAGEWGFEQAEVEVEGRAERIDLLLTGAEESVLSVGRRSGGAWSLATLGLSPPVPSG